MELVNESYSKSIARLYSDAIDDELDLGDEEPDWDDPFFAAAKRGMEKRRLPSKEEAM
jgi:hypothetical protein